MTQITVLNTITTINKIYQTHRCSNKLIMKRRLREPVLKDYIDRLFKVKKKTFRV